MGHKILKAVADRDSPYQLGGLVEMDDAFIGPQKSGPPGRGAKGKAKVVIAVESWGNHARLAVMRHVPSIDSDQVRSVAQEKIQPVSDGSTDEWRACGTPGSDGFGHESVVVGKDRESVKQLRWVHVLTANIRGKIQGVYPGVSDEYLGRYLAESSYRFNRRRWDSQLFNRTIRACVPTSTVTFVKVRA